MIKWKIVPITECFRTSTGFSPEVRCSTNPIREGRGVTASERKAFKNENYFYFSLTHKTTTAQQGKHNSYTKHMALFTDLTVQNNLTLTKVSCNLC